MVDIIQLKENGEPKYLKTHAKAVDELLEYTWPIGSVYISVTSTNPSDIFGGTWQQIAAGRTLVGVDTNDNVLNAAKKVGGSVNPLTSHGHTITGKTYRVASNSGTGTNTIGRSTDTGNPLSGNISDVVAANKGDNTNHNNWQPFMTVYFWERTA